MCGADARTRYGAFDSFEHKHMADIRTKYDEYIDLHSNKPHEQSYEKMIAGLYLGEIFRLVMCDLVDEGVLFLGQNTYKIEKPNVFDTAFLSLIESDPTDELLTVTGLFAHFFGLETTMEERKFFRQLAELIGTRAARLSSCGIAAIARKMGYEKEGCEVGADGSLYSKYPRESGAAMRALARQLTASRRLCRPPARGAARPVRQGLQDPQPPGRGRQRVRRVEAFAAPCSRSYLFTVSARRSSRA